MVEAASQVGTATIRSARLDNFLIKVCLRIFEVLQRLLRASSRFSWALFSGRPGGFGTKNWVTRSRRTWFNKRSYLSCSKFFTL